MRVPWMYIRNAVETLEAYAESGKAGQRLQQIHRDAYEQGFVIPDYQEIWARSCCANKPFHTCTDAEVNGLTEAETLAGISMIYRGDRFCEGLLGECTRDGTLLRLYRRLMTLATAEREAEEAERL